MMRFHKLLTNCLGIGYIKGGGTIAAAFTCTAWYLARTVDHFNWVALIATVVVILMGTWSASVVEKDWGKDSSRVVIDEVAGMMIGLLFIPVTLTYLLAGFVLFRLLDITKPLMIRRTESLPGGWGVMMDDVVAGAYTNLLLHTIMWLNVF